MHENFTYVKMAASYICSFLCQLFCCEMALDNKHLVVSRRQLLAKSWSNMLFIVQIKHFSIFKTFAVGLCKMTLMAYCLHISLILNMSP